MDAAPIGGQAEHHCGLDSTWSGTAEEHEIDFPHGWTVHPMAAAAGVFLKTLAMEPPIKSGTPDPYTAPKPGELRPDSHFQLGVITQYDTVLVRSHDELPQPDHGIEQQTG